AGTAGQESLSEVQVGGVCGHRCGPSAAGRDCLGSLASPEGRFIGILSQPLRRFAEIPVAFHPRLTVLTSTLIFSVSDRQSEGSNATLERVLSVWRRCPGWF